MKLSNSLFERIADFLKEHPPFQYFEMQDLQNLAKIVRIKFHEKDEIVFEEGFKRRKHFFIVFKGSVCVTNNRQGKRTIKDIRKVGELLGTGHLFDPDGDYVNTATTREDTILYSIPWIQFADLLPIYPESIRFLKAHISLRSDFNLPSMAHRVEMFPNQGQIQSDSMTERLGQTTQLAEFAKGRFVDCQVTETLQEVAYKMLHNKAEAIVVTNEKSHPLGMVTKTDLAKAAQAGRNPSEAKANEFMSSPVITVESNPQLGSCLRIMMKSGYQHLCLTEDGTSDSAACGVISERDLMLYYGNNPMVIIRQIGEIHSFEELSHMRHRADMLALNDMRSAESVGWFSEVIHDLNRAFVKKVIRLSLNSLRLENVYMPPSSFCLFFAGLGGRKELFTRNAMDRGLIYAPDHPDETEACKIFYQRLAERVNEGLLKCGWTANKQGFSENNPLWCQPLGVWKQYFADWIGTDDLDVLYKNLLWFDTLYADGFEHLLDELFLAKKVRIERNDAFIRKLCQATLKYAPDASVYEDFNMAGEDGKAVLFDLGATLVKPMVEAARCLALSHGILAQTSTYERFRQLSIEDATRAPLYSEASEGFRIALLIGARTGLNQQTNGRIIDPAHLSGLEIQLVKSTFRTLMRLQNLIEEVCLERTPEGEDQSG